MPTANAHAIDLREGDFFLILNRQNRRQSKSNQIPVRSADTLRASIGDSSVWRPLASGLVSPDEAHRGALVRDAERGERAPPLLEKPSRK